MTDTPDCAPDLVELIRPLVRADGFTPTAIDDVRLVASRESVARTPLLYEPCLIVIAQGRKVGYLGDRTIHYDAGHYLVQTVPLPFECETTASPDAPLMGVSVRIDTAMLRELVMELGDSSPAQREPAPHAMASVAMTAGMHEAVARLLRALHDPRDARVMGRARIREVLFEALKGAQAPALRALVRHHGRYTQLVQVLSRMHAAYTEDLSVDALAREANMSVSAFHQHFRRVTRSTPLQYLKRLRLIKARLLLSQDDLNVSQTALAVGYRSIPQFSRDYKRYFGTSPLKDRQRAA